MLFVFFTQLSGGFVRLSQRLCRSTTSCLFQVPGTMDRVSRLSAAQAEPPAVSWVRTMTSQRLEGVCQTSHDTHLTRSYMHVSSLECGRVHCIHPTRGDMDFGGKHVRKRCTYLNRFSVNCFDICMIPL